MQASIAIIGFLCGVAAWYQSGEMWWLIGAAVLLANWPFTLIAIMPTNKAMMDTPLEAANVETRSLMKRWGKLHAVRTLLGTISTAIFLWLQI